MICWGEHRQTTSAGQALHVEVKLPNTYSKFYTCSTSTTRRNNWQYSDMYSCTLMIEDLSTMSVRCIGANNSQYIDGFFWITVGT